MGITCGLHTGILTLQFLAPLDLISVGRGDCIQSHGHGLSRGRANLGPVARLDGVGRFSLSPGNEATHTVSPARIIPPRRRYNY
jgi:hypothetical protein